MHTVKQHGTRCRDGDSRIQLISESRSNDKETHDLNSRRMARILMYTSWTVTKSLFPPFF